MGPGTRRPLPWLLAPVSPVGPAAGGGPSEGWGRGVPGAAADYCRRAAGRAADSAEAAGGAVVVGSAVAVAAAWSEEGPVGADPAPAAGAAERRAGGGGTVPGRVRPD